LIIQPDLLKTLQKYFHPDEKYYLVGGTVRDHLLNLTSNDLDIVCTCDTRTIARKIADEYSGAFYMLDEERNTCRVIVAEPGGKKLLFDFAQLRNEDIEIDLRDRDFTINAMAIDLSLPGVIIDPLHGKRDLERKVLTPCSESSFDDDPVRMIRAVRYAVGLGLSISEDVKNQISGALTRLMNVSAERKRDELFKILQCSNAEISFRLLNDLGLLKALEIEPANINVTIRRLGEFESFTNALVNEQDKRTPVGRTWSQLLSEIEVVRVDLGQHLDRVITDGRSMYSLDKLTVILWDLPEPIVTSFITALNLSNQESDTILKMFRMRNQIYDFYGDVGSLEDRSIYRYFKALGQSGVDLAIISMVDQICEFSSVGSTSALSKAYGITVQLVRAWFKRISVVSPAPLLRGTDLFMEFDLSPGPLIGNLLEGLREEQAAGTVHTRQEALTWVEDELVRKTAK
jgi:poly(A) polymerase